VTIATEIANVGLFRGEQMLLRSRLARLRRRLRLQMALEFALEAAAVLVAAAAVLVFLDWWFRLGPTARLVLLIIALIGVVPFNLVRALRRWRASRLDDLSPMVLGRSGRDRADRRCASLPGFWANRRAWSHRR
jgi:hypothetical protein